jgi:hypothetical protein
MLTVTPSPKMIDIIKCFFSKGALDRSGCLKNWSSSKSDRFFLFSRTAWSLKAIILWYRMFYSSKSNDTVIWVPDYFCNQTILVIKQLDCKIKFYPVDASLQPKKDRCEVLAEHESPDIFILVHYFGIAAQTKWAKEFCKKHQTVLVEDAAHVLASNDDIGKVGDFVLYSLHKNLPIPDGAICVMRGKNVKSSAGVDPYATMDNVILSMGDKSPLPVKWILKRVIQKVLCLLGLEGVVFYFKHQAQSFYWDGPLVKYEEAPAMSAFSKKMLTYVCKDLQTVAVLRQKNQLIWQFIIANFFKTCSVLTSPNCSAFVPYVALVKCNDMVQASYFYSEFIKFGFSPQTWPDLSPEVKLDDINHSDAIALRNSLILLPVHQSLALQGMAAAFLSRYISQINPELSSLVMHEVDMETWDDLFEKSDDVNLLQCSNYTNAKALVEGWEVKRYCIKDGLECVAIFQVLKKKIGPIIVMRINRGPLWQVKNLDLKLKLKVLSKIKTLVKGMAPKFLFIAPWLEESVENSIILSSLGYYRRKKEPGWQSILLDLSKTAEMIRKDFLSRWRCALQKSEQYGLRYVIDNSPEALTILLDDYMDFQKGKEFNGINREILKESVKNCSRSMRFIVVAAYYNDQRVSSALIALSGQVATYLIGINSDVGRNIGANNFLLWEVILTLKNLDCKWFDLGGVDYKNTPGISSFKEGLGGRLYQLQGEYLVW